MSGEMIETTAAQPQRATRERPPKLLLLGDVDAFEPVQASLASLRAEVEPVSEAEAVEPGRGEIAAVIARPGPGSRPGRDLARLREHLTVPLFVIVGDGCSGAAVRKLYEGGAAGVFEWPKEGLLLARFLAEMLALRFARGRAGKADQALARTVRTHLKLLPGLQEVPRVEARDGVVRASGSVESLTLKQEIERCVSGVPGVRGLDVGSLHVLGARVPDRQIRSAARRLLEISPDLDARTLSVTVEAGRLTLHGSTASMRELRRLEELAARISGVRSVTLDINVSDAAQRADRSTAQRLNRALDALFPDDEVRAACFGDTTVLTGSTSTLRTRREIARVVSELPGVTKLVDKIQVSGPGQEGES
jgi:osmotically-inducible protein OsmY